MGKVSAATRWGICVASRLPVSRLQYKGAVEEPPSEYGKHPKKRFSTSRAHNQGIDSRKARKGEYRAGFLRIPAIWFMLNQNDITNPIKLKLTACRTRETEEAEKFLGLDQAYKRARLAISDSVSLTIFFHREVSMCFEHYVNVGEESVFVLVSQYNVVAETNERGALHLHGLLWLQGNMHLGTLSRDIQGEEHVAYRKRVIDYVDSIFSELDLDEGASAVMRAETSVTAGISRLIGNTRQFAASFEEEANFCAGAVQVHTHSPTCVKYVIGRQQNGILTGLAHLGKW
ncbi:hypothetical protein FOMG_18431 [Fusarium oxysporum f. sp. melonis 26406]|uniref:Helitron helicase-like domain-containing protein n=1 Tax=Fusarium oxysporum f. sp. melonis 26406 TaxID=1089452 RepID=W9Z8C1_FUSOX|nr:hypothetical protein FOMG_18431 [Fusarium oxysporum f. sp. melonis 26406]